MVSGEVVLKRTRSRNWVMYWLGVGLGDVVSRMRVGEYVFQSVSGSSNGCEGLIIGCWDRVVYHSVNDRYCVMF